MLLFIEISKHSIHDPLDSILCKLFGLILTIGLINTAIPTACDGVCAAYVVGVVSFFVAHAYAVGVLERSGGGWDQLLVFVIRCR